MNDLQRKLQSIGTQNNNITDFNEVYGLPQSKSNRLLSISDQNIIHNLQDTEGTEQNEGS